MEVMVSFMEHQIGLPSSAGKASKAPILKTKAAWSLFRFD
jgi:hypothetical protein